MTSQLPTVNAASWTVTALRDSLLSELAADVRGTELRLFFYAVTETGWREVRPEILHWRSRRQGRSVIAYVGTDHGITEAEAIRLMAGDGIGVRLMTAYSGVFHPKLVWLHGPKLHCIWIGSNNLTRDGLLNNIEFAAMVRSNAAPDELERWAAAVHGGSSELKEEMLEEYDAERRQYNERRVTIGTFTWSRRERIRVRKSQGGVQSAPVRDALSFPRKGDLILEVMPRETGQDGKQIQLPMAVVTSFFGLKDRVGYSRTITLTPAWIDDPRTLTMTIFPNSTTRFVIRELDYRDRPCVLLFRRLRPGKFAFEIISRSVFPLRYRQLLARCRRPTRQGSRRWGVIS